MLIAIVAAMAAGACFAVGGVLQQRAASVRPERESLTPRLLRDLMADRVWRWGISLAVAAYGFQSLALSFGPLAVVQPLIVTELLFAIPLSARLYRLRLGVREWCGAVAVAAGLATALAATNPHGGNRVAPHERWLAAITVVGAATGVALLVGRRLGEIPRTSLIALAAGLVMGTQSALLATTVTHLRAGFLPLVTAWQTYLLVVASIGGLLLIQSAFQAGPLAASLPVIDAVEPAVAVTIGIMVFHEQVRFGWLSGATAVLGMITLATGIVLLDTSKLLQALHRRQRKRRAEEQDQPP
ncbi:DMT family transporter [Phytohabitans kaempferiae]|uniref:DMT family transporter n=1 Tax=Phytohabitans kaempferiae TaxID=1620943 RepID=A0ABV6M4U7_9ACTN